MMVRQINRVDKTIEKIKNNKFLSVIIVVGIILIGIGQLTDSLNKIYESFSSKKTDQIDSNSFRTKPDSMPHEVDTVDIELAKAIDIIKNFYNLEDISIYKYLWLDLSNQGKKNELCAYYSNTKFDIIDVFTRYDQSYDNIYHIVVESEILDFLQYRIDSKTFLIITNEHGKTFMGFDIFYYDGIGKLKELQTFVDFYLGNLLIKNNNLLLFGNNQKFIVKYDSNSNSFFLEQVLDSLSTDTSPSSHILSYEIKIS